MATKSKNKIWVFLASVKLALLLIALLASTSIIGTVVQQNKPPEHYVEQWGENSAKLIQTLNFDDMYNSIWFLSLLGAFSLNLIVCSLDRIPTVIRIVNKDNLTTAPERLMKMKLHQEKQIQSSLSAAKEEVTGYLAGKGWKTDARDKEHGTLFFAQKGAWTRYGVYVVHISILIILLGAIIGSSTVATKILKNPEFAFKGGVSLPETAKSDFIFSYADGRKIPLGFTVRCNFFNIEYYPNSTMPKDYVSGLTVLESGKEVLSKIIEVNKPLTYKGVTFYQSSYNELGTPIIKLKNKTTDQVHVFPVDPKHYDVTHNWKEGETKGMIRIQSVKTLQMPGARGDTQLKIWMMDSKGPPSMFSMLYDTPVIIERPDTNYELRIGPHFATGLQVAKDPGVWWVYAGCALMLIGLYVAFFMSHRKIWAYVSEIDGQPIVVFAGNANKNKMGFTQTFSALTNGFQERKQ
ncbi:MAG: cytochrome c biogenesis protein ResB [Candidatus Electrothrix sp. AR4]|nr:cytochrome c biogenesis protein ResB [Candidatus Electrothrix sp. AR4]